MRPAPYRVLTLVAERYGLPRASLAREPSPGPCGRAGRNAVWIARQISQAIASRVGTAFGIEDGDVVVRILREVEVERAENPLYADELDTAEAAIAKILRRENTLARSACMDASRRGASLGPW